MNKNEILVVSGFGRCGTSLVMQMLYDGGMPVYYDKVGSFETDKSTQLPRNDKWLEDCKGKAVKILDLHRFVPTPRFDYRFIWLSRRPRDQAASTVKFWKATGNRFNKKDHELKTHLRVSYTRDIATCLDVIRGLANKRLPLMMQFEDIIANPLSSAGKLSNFIENTLDIDKMAKAVLPRKPECLDYMMEDQIMEKYKE
tara:strand:+ start:19686 stop:20282 length:597 start_codon:yes stop_codon:yes gene_type:complete